MTNLKIIIPILFITMFLLLWVAGCFPDRYPVGPEESATRRPQVSFISPFDGDDVKADSLDAIEIWFDMLMDESSVSEKFNLSLVVGDELGTELNNINQMDQSKSEPDLLVLCRADLGSFYSRDRGTSWIFWGSLAEITVKMLKIDPDNASTIYALNDSILLKSQNGGESWDIINNNLPDDVLLMHISFDPSNSVKIWLATSEGVFKSSDGGLNWISTGSLPSWTGHNITQISVDPKNSDIIYVSTLGRYVYKSIDDGVNWEMRRGDVGRLGTTRIYDIIVDPDSSHLIYAASINQGVYKSNDGAENWFQINAGISDLNARILHFHKIDNNRLYMVSGESLYQSGDKGESWLKISIPGNGINRSFYGDTQNATNLLLATSNVVNKSMDQGEGWEDINTIDESSIQIQGSFTFSSWQDTISFILKDEDDQIDTIYIAPYRYDDALAAYDAGVQSTAPVDPNPKATKAKFSPHSKLYIGWQYWLTIKGAFDDSGWRGEHGARNTNGMSVEYDENSYFYTE